MLMKALSVLIRKALSQVKKGKNDVTGNKRNHESDG